MKVSSSVGDNSHLEAKRCKTVKDGRIQQQYNIIQYAHCSQYNIMQCNNTIYPPLLMTLPCPWLQMILSWLAAYGGGKWWYDTFLLWWIQEILGNAETLGLYSIFAELLKKGSGLPICLSFGSDHKSSSLYWHYCTASCNADDKMEGVLVWPGGWAGNL